MGGEKRKVATLKATAHLLHHFCGIVPEKEGMLHGVGEERQQAARVGMKDVGGGAAVVVAPLQQQVTPPLDSFLRRQRCGAFQLRQGARRADRHAAGELKVALSAVSPLPLWVLHISDLLLQPRFLKSIGEHHLLRRPLRRETVNGDWPGLPVPIDAIASLNVSTGTWVSSR